jgi:hypothetical protein
MGPSGSDADAEMRAAQAHAKAPALVDEGAAEEGEDVFRVAAAAVAAAAKIAPDSVSALPVDRKHLDAAVAQLSMHTLSHLFLSPRYAQLFNWSVMLHFGSILTSYALAGSVSMAKIFGAGEGNNAYFVAPFVLSLTATLIYFARRIALVVSFLTAVKLLLILIMVFAVMAIAGAARQQPVDDWAFVMHPFLISTVALGGMASLMPVMARSVPVHSARAQRTFLAAVCGGLIVCWALNVAWASSVLSIVPQTAAQAVAQGLPGDASLERAAALGQISTVAVSSIVDAKFPQFKWVSGGVSVFIALSISVSFVIMGTGLKSVLEGVAMAKFWTHVGSADEGLHQGMVLGEGDGPRSRAASAVGVPSLAGPASVAAATPQSAARVGAALFATPPSGSLAANSTAAAASSPGGSSSRLRTAARLVRFANQVMDVYGVFSARVLALLSTGAAEASRFTYIVLARRVPWIKSEAGRRRLLLGFAFGLVLLLALLNPGSFLFALEVFTSLALNLSSGTLVALMFSAAAAGTTASGGVQTLGDREDAAMSAPVVPIAWPLPAALRRWLPGFVSITFAAAIAWDILETAAYLIGWPAAQWLALAFLSWIWHGRGLALCVEALLRPLGWAVPGASAQNPFLHLVRVLGNRH